MNVLEYGSVKVIYSHSFYPVYASDPAAVAGRIEAVMNALPSDLELIEAEPATEVQIALAHTMDQSTYARKGFMTLPPLQQAGPYMRLGWGLKYLPLAPFGHPVTMPQVTAAGAFAISTTWRWHC